MLPERKIQHFKNLSNHAGVIAAVAMDQRGSLLKSIAKERGVDPKTVTADDVAGFKGAVARVLTPHASAILLDPEYSLGIMNDRAKNAGLLLAYELSGYDNTHPGRLPDLLPHLSVRRLQDWGADAVKILLYYAPGDEPQVNDIKHAFIERIGAECETYGLPFFLECVGYDPAGGDEHGFEFAKKRPEVVTASMQEFSKQQYKVDVLKVEVPVNLHFVEGSSAYSGQKAQSLDEARALFRRASDATAKPFIYLSGGVTNHQFIESLQLAAEAGANYSGVLCGHATWQDGIPIYAKQGLKALEDWLADKGVRNINAVNEAVKPATSLFKRLGVTA